MLLSIENIDKKIQCFFIFGKGGMKYVNEENKPGYYAVIPASVRYCKELKYPERLLYGEITSLLNKEGYCFASNRYFAELYGVIQGTVSRWISNLEKCGFIKVLLIRDDNKQIIERRIYITDNSCRNFMVDTYKQNRQYPCEQNKQYPISRNDKDTNINIRIDRFFNYIITKQKQNLTREFSNEADYEEFLIILEKLDMNYTKELIDIFTEENVSKIKYITFCIKEILCSNKKYLIGSVNKMQLIDIYDKCKKIQLENEDTTNKIRNFFEYYYASVIKKLEGLRRENDRTI